MGSTTEWNKQFCSDCGGYRRAPSQLHALSALQSAIFQCRDLPEGIGLQPTLPNGSAQGKNDFDQLGFDGPCPLNGTHCYIFKLFAIARPLNLQPGASKAELLQAIKGHTLEIAQLLGRYAR